MNRDVDLRPFSELTVIERLRLCRANEPTWTTEAADEFIERAIEVFPCSVEVDREEAARS